MKKNIFRPLCAFVAACLTAGVLAGCEADNSVAAQKDTQSSAPVTLKIMLWGDKPNGLDDVVAEFEKQTKDTLNTKLNITWTPLGDYKNLIQLKLAAGEEIDSVFDAGWNGMQQRLDQNLYFDISSYFNNDSVIIGLR